MVNSPYVFICTVDYETMKSSFSPLIAFLFDHLFCVISSSLAQSRPVAFLVKNYPKGKLLKHPTSYVLVEKS